MKVGVKDMTKREIAEAERVGKSSGLDYGLDVLVGGGLLTCEECGRLPGYWPGPGQARAQARRHLGASHKMELDD